MGENEQAGVLMYLPVYRTGAPHSTLAQRRVNIIGWVNSAFRMDDLMRGIFGEHADDLDIDVYKRQVLDSLVGSILNSRPSVLSTKQGKARVAGLPYDPGRLELFEILAEQLRSTGLPQPVSVTQTDVARRHFAFLESYFSNLSLIHI